MGQGYPFFLQRTDSQYSASAMMDTLGMFIEARGRLGFVSDGERATPVLECALEGME